MSNNKESNNLKWIQTETVVNFIIPNLSSEFSRRTSLEVIPGNWDTATVPLEFHPKAQYCRGRWSKGLDWPSTNAINYYGRMIRNDGSFDKCRNEVDVLNRFRVLDLIYSEIQKSNALKTRFELSLTASPTDETGGIFVHFDRSGKPIFGGGGWHRLMIAKILEIPSIPIQIGIIHENFARDLGEKITNF